MMIYSVLVQCLPCSYTSYGSSFLRRYNLDFNSYSDTFLLLHALCNICCYPERYCTVSRVRASDNQLYMTFRSLSLLPLFNNFFET